MGEKVIVASRPVVVTLVICKGGERLEPVPEPPPRAPAGSRAAPPRRDGRASPSPLQNTLLRSSVLLE